MLRSRMAVKNRLAPGKASGRSRGAGTDLSLQMADSIGRDRRNLISRLAAARITISKPSDYVVLKLQVRIPLGRSRPPRGAEQRLELHDSRIHVLGYRQGACMPPNVIE